jgi:hypothetical protein
MINKAKQLWIHVQSRYQPHQDRAVQFFERVWNRTEPFIQSKPRPVANTTPKYPLSIAHPIVMDNPITILYINLSLPDPW